MRDKAGRVLDKLFPPNLLKRVGQPVILPGEEHAGFKRILDHRSRPDKRLDYLVLWDDKSQSWLAEEQFDNNLAKNIYWDLQRKLAAKPASVPEKFHKIPLTLHLTQSKHIGGGDVVKPRDNVDPTVKLTRSGRESRMNPKYK